MQKKMSFNVVQFFLIHFLGLSKYIMAKRYKKPATAGGSNSVYQGEVNMSI